MPPVMPTHEVSIQHLIKPSEAEMDGLWVLDADHGLQEYLSQPV